MLFGTRGRALERQRTEEEATPAPPPRPEQSPNAPGAPPRATRPPNASPRRRPTPRRLENNTQFKVAGFNKNIKNLKNTINKLQKNISTRNKNKNNKVSELQKKLTNYMTNIREMIKTRTEYMHRFSNIRGRPTNYYSPNTFSRYYRAPPVHKGLAQYYYYQQPGVPRYVQQLPARVWHINQGGRGLPPIPFYPTRRQVRRAPRRGR
jgi:hypothetical protein